MQVLNVVPRSPRRTRAAFSVLVVFITAFLWSCGGGPPPTGFEACAVDGDYGSVTATVECVIGTGTAAIAVFRTNNAAPAGVSIPLGPSNSFEPTPSGRGQPTSFAAAGSGYFATPLGGASLTWRLGPSTAIASSTSLACKKVVNEGNGVAVILLNDTKVVLREDTSGVLEGAVVPVPRQPNSPNQDNITSGNVPGAFRLGADGSASYSVAIKAPPGRAGLEPALSLSYNSNAGNGPLGVGWSLGGLSEIRRCNKTVASDGQAVAVRYDDTDRFCLNGDYLIARPRDPNAGGVASFQPEHDRNTLVTLDATDGSGPVTFHVFRPNGRIEVYGTNDGRLEGPRGGWTANPMDGSSPPSAMPAATVRLAWFVSEVEDRSGNGYYVLYEDPDPECRASGCPAFDRKPSEIRYTYRASDAPGPDGRRPTTRRVHFTWDPATRPDPIEQWVSGLPLRDYNLLRAVEFFAPYPNTEGLARKYEFAYAQDSSPSPTGRALLSALRECDRSHTCTPWTSFEYSGGSTTFKHEETVLPVEVPAEQHRYLLADINGDGFDDILFRKTFSTVKRDGACLKRTYAWWIAFGNGAGFEKAKDTGLPLQISYCVDPSPDAAPLPMPHAIDLNGDGKMELAMPVISLLDDPLQPQFWKFFTYVAGGFSEWESDDTPEKQGCWLNFCTWPGSAGMYLGDLDGDGLPEAFHRFADKNSCEIRWAVRRNNGGTLSPSYQILADATGSFGFLRDSASVIGDVDGSGHQALLLWPYTGPVESTGTGGCKLTAPVPQRLAALTLSKGDPSAHAASTTLLVKDSGGANALIDFNGDGAGDALTLPESRGWPKIAMNSGQGFPPSVEGVEATSFKIPAFSMRRSDVRLLDLNGDAHPDILVAEADVGLRKKDGLTTSMVAYHYRPGRKKKHSFEFTPAAVLVRDAAGIHALTVDERGPKQTEIGDINGDGQADIVELQYGGGKSVVHVYRREGSKPELLTKVADGIGAITSVGYESKPLSDETGICKYPASCKLRGQWVVKEYSEDRGSLGGGGHKFYKVEYEGPRLDLTGRGWLGFERRTVTDLQFGARWVTEYDNSFTLGTAYPKARYPSSERLVVPLGRGKTYSRLVTTQYDVLGAGAGQPFSVVPAVITVVEKDGAATVRQGSVSYIYDAHDNVTHWEEVTNGGSTVNTHDATFTNRENVWLLGLPDTTTTTSSEKIGGSFVSETHRARFFPNPTTGLLDRKFEGEVLEGTTALATGYLRDGDGQVIAVTQTSVTGATREVSLGYTPDGFYVSRFTDALGHTTTYDYHPALGVVVRSRRPDSTVWSASYDEFARVVEERDPSLGVATFSYELGLFGPRVSARNAATGVSAVADFDQLGRLRHKKITQPDGTFAHVSIDFDNYHLDKLAFVSQPWVEGDGFVVGTSFRYDNVGRVEQQIDPGDARTRFFYDGLKRRSVDPDGNQHIETYDTRGRTTWTTDPLGLGKGGKTKDVTTAYSYGPFDRVRQMTDALGALTSFAFDVRGRRTSITDPNTGTTTYVYNAFDDLIRYTDANGTTTTVLRDVGGRRAGVRAVDAKGGVDLSCFRYDEGATGVGRLTSTTSADGIKRRFGFDSAGRPNRWEWDVSGTALAIDATYDSAGQVTELRYPKSSGAPEIVATYKYLGGRMHEIYLGADRIWRAERWDGQGAVAEATLGNGLISRFTFDPTTRFLTRIEALDGSAHATDLTYEYFKSGRIKSRTDATAPADALRGRYEEFRYDSLGRLADWSKPGQWSIDYDYDAIGSLVGRHETIGSKSSSLTFGVGEGGAGPQHLTSSSAGAKYSYDSVGNQLTAPGRTVDYVRGGRLPRRVTRASEVTRFGYDAQGLRASKSGGGSVSLYAGELYERRTDSLGAVTHVFTIKGEDGPLVQVVASASGTKRQYLHLGRYGSVEAVTDDTWSSTKSVLERLHYDPFGRRVDPRDPTSPLTPVLASSSSGFENFEHDDDLTLVNMRGRLYDPLTARYLAPDPNISYPKQSQALNRYSYAYNSPGNFTDPSGLAPTGGGGPDPGGPGGHGKFVDCISAAECARLGGTPFAPLPMPRPASDDLGFGKMGGTPTLPPSAPAQIQPALEAAKIMAAEAPVIAEEIEVMAPRIGNAIIDAVRSKPELLEEVVVVPVRVSSTANSLIDACVQRAPTLWQTWGSTFKDWYSRGRAFHEAFYYVMDAVENQSQKLRVVGLKGGAIPDILQRSYNEIYELKDVGYLVMTNQLRILSQWALQNGFRLNLVISPNTLRVSQPVVDAVRATGGNVYRFYPIALKFTVEF